MVVVSELAVGSIPAPPDPATMPRAGWRAAAGPGDFGRLTLGPFRALEGQLQA